VEKEFTILCGEADQERKEKKRRGAEERGV